MKTVQDLGGNWHITLWHHEDVDFNDKKVATFCKIKKQETEDDPTREETDQAKAIGWMLIKRTDEQKTGYASQIIYAGKNKLNQEKKGKTAPATSKDEEQAGMGIFLVKDYEELDKKFNKFENYGEETEHSAHSGRPLVQGEAVMLIPATGEMKSHERIVGDTGILIADQEEGKHSPAVFAMTGKAIDERLNAGVQTLVNVRKDKGNQSVLAYNMHDGSDGIKVGHGYFWWKNFNGLTISPYHEFAPFKFGTGGGNDKHWHLDNEDGEPINSLHFSKTRTFYHESQREDAPDLYEGETQDPGGVFDIPMKIFHHYYNDSRHAFLKGSRKGHYIWVGTLPIDTETPPKVPPVETPSKTAKRQRVFPPDIDWHPIPKKEFIPVDPWLPYDAQVNVNQYKKFNTRYTNQNLSLPCMQLVAQVPNQYMGEEGYDFESLAAKKMHNVNFMREVYSWNPNLQYQTEAYQKEYLAGFLKREHYQNYKLSRPFVCSIDAVGKVQTASNKKQFNHSLHPGNSTHAFARGTVDGIVAVFPPEMSTHWNSGSLSLSTTHWGYYETVPVGWFRAIDDDATMTDKKSCYFVPDIVGGEVNLDLQFYTTGASRTGIFSVKGTINATSSVCLLDDVPINFGGAVCGTPDATIDWDTGLTPHGLHIQTLGAGDYMRITTSNTGRVEITDGNDNLMIGVNAGLGRNAGAIFNVAIGEETFGGTAGTATLLADYNVCIGYQALASLTDGSSNFCFGYQSGQNITTGTNNFGLGYRTLDSVVDGIDNVAIGSIALFTNVSGNGNIAIGRNAGNLITLSNNICIGNYACDLSGAVQRNVIIGGHACGGVAGGSDNVVVGYLAGYVNPGSGSVFLGYRAGRYETASNKLFIDNAARANEADGRVKALMYGIFAAATANQNLHFNSHVETRHIQSYLKQDVTIEGGIIAITASNVHVAPQGGAADNLDTINGGVEGAILYLTAEATPVNTVTLTDGVGNLALSGNFTMDSAHDVIHLIYDIDLALWLEVSRSNNA